MAEPTQDPAGGSPPPADPAPAPAPDPGADPTPEPTPQATPGAPVQLTSDQLQKRLQEEREKARVRLLKDLGFEKAEDVRTRLQKAKELEDAQLSELERAQNRVKELEPEAQRATKLAERFAAMVDERLQALPEAQREIVEQEAGDDPEERLRLMRVLKVASGNGSDATGDDPPKPKPAPANTSGGTPPVPSNPRTKFEEWQAMKQRSGMAADIFYRANHHAIEASRPAPTS